MEVDKFNDAQNVKESWRKDTDSDSRYHANLYRPPKDMLEGWVGT